MWQEHIKACRRSNNACLQPERQIRTCETESCCEWRTNDGGCRLTTLWEIKITDWTFLSKATRAPGKKCANDVEPATRDAWPEAHDNLACNVQRAEARKRVRTVG